MIKQVKFLLLFSFGFLFSISTFAISGTITGTTAVCQNATSPVITFTGSGGTAPYTFTYKINNGLIQTVVTSVGSSVTVAAPTTTDGTFIYTLTKVVGGTTKSYTVLPLPSATITVNPSPDASLNSSPTVTTIGASPGFKLCGVNQLTFTNASTTAATNTNYTIDWGDGSPFYEDASFAIIPQHIYASGSYTLTYTVTGEFGCQSVNTYLVYAGASPIVSFGLDNNASKDICTGEELKFVISNTEGNTPGTIYTVTYNDGSAPIVYTSSPPTQISHFFSKSSCGTTSDGYDNSFSAIITAVNPCLPLGTTVRVAPIYVSSMPVADFTLPSTILCTKTAVCLTNTTTGNEVSSADPTTCKVPKSVWTITPSAGVTLNSGTLGSFNTQPADPNLWTSGSSVICPKFANPGSYTISLKVGNRCGIDEKIKTIVYVESSLTPQFTLSSNAGCTPLTVNTTNTTDLTNSPSPTYLWGVTYAASNCGTAPATWSYSVGNQNSASPSFNFVTPGTYTITLSMTNTCGTVVSAEQTVEVKKPPTVTINPISNYCGTASVQPVAVVSSCAPPASTLTYSWSFPGGSPATATTLDPGTISYSALGNYTISLSVTNECGTVTTSSNEFFVTEIPTVDAVASQVKCNAALSDLITFTGSGTGVVFDWINATPGIGLAASGTGNIPAFTVQNSGTTIVTANLTVTPKIAATGCTGTPKNFSITVNPTGEVIQPSSQIVSNGISTSQVDFATNNIGGVTSYAWTNSAPSIGLAGNGTGSILSFTATNSTTGPVSATISVVPTFTNGLVNCAGASKDFLLTVNPTAQVNVGTGNVEICNGRLFPTTNFSTLNTGGTTTYSWTNTNTTIGLAASGTGSSIPAFSVINVGAVPEVATVTVTPTFSNGGDSNVGPSAQFTITVAPASIINAQPVSSTVCQGGTPTVLSVGYQYGEGTPSYQWYSHTTSSTVGGTPIGTNSASYAPLSAVVGTTYYYCIITMSSGFCPVMTSEVATVVITPQATISVQPTPNQQVCVGGVISAALTVAASGGSGTPSYKWFSHTINSNSGGTEIPLANSASYTPPSFGMVGTYYFYAEVSMSGGGCGAIYSNPAKIEVVADPVVTAPALALQTLCEGATPIDLSILVNGGVGSYSYQWYENTADNTATGSIIPSAQSSSYTPITTSIGTKYYYCVVGQSGAGCGVVSASSAVVVNAIPTFAIQPIGSTVCVGEVPGTLSVTSIGGVGLPSYKWYSNSNTGWTLIPSALGNSYTPSSSVAGTIHYYCVVSYALGGCSTIVSDVATVLVHPNPIIGTQNSRICSGSGFEVIPNELAGDVVPVGTSYTWSAPVINPLGAITGGDAQGVPQSSIAQVLTNTTSLSATATYSVTPVSGSCLGNSFTVVVEVVPTILPNAVVGHSSCFGANGGSILTNIVGGLPFDTGSAYTTSWSGPNGYSSNSPSISGLSPGDYTLLVTDAANCPVTQTYTITEPSAVLVTTDLKNDISCFGAGNGKISISVSGGTSPYNTVWTKNGNAYSTSEDLDLLGAAVYELSVSDTQGCTAQKAIFTVVEPAVLAVSLASQSDVKCFGSATGAIQIDVQGGVKSEVSAGVFDYHYAWSGPNGFVSSSKNISSLLLGVYTVTVTDENGCFQSLAVTIHQAEELVLSTSFTPISSVGNDGSITLTISGGVAPYDVQWSNLGGGLVQTDLSPGSYIITVTDANSCQKSVTVVLMDADFSIHPVVKNVLCNGDKNGSISLFINGGTPPLKVVWTDNLTAGSVRNGLAAGNYTMTLSDAIGSKITQSFLIVEPQALIVTGSVSNAFDCSNPNSGSINLTVFGGTQPYSFAWSNGGDTEDVTGIPMGSYTVVVTDAKGCVKTVSFEVLRQNPIVASFSSVDHFSCETKKDSKIYTAQVTGGVPPYQLSWSSGVVSGVNNEVMESSQDGIVSLLVKDGSGCTSSSSFNVVIPVIAIPAISFTTQPTPLQSICVGGSISTPFSVAYSGGSGIASYKWFVNTVNSTVGGLEIAGANQSTYLPTAYSSIGSYYYYAELTLTGDRCCPLFSAIGRVNVVSDPIVNTQPLTTQTLCQGGVAQDLKVELTGGLGVYQYQWFVNTSNDNIGGLLISPATNSTFTPSTTSIGLKYYYCVISQDGLGCSVVSNTAQIVVNSIPAFTTQPISSTLCLGELASQLTVGYSNGVGLPSYRWYSSSIPSTLAGAIIPGATGSSYLPTVSSVGTTYYYCILSFSSGDCSILVSDVSKVTVNPKAVIASQLISLCSDASFNVKPREIGGNVVPDGTTYSWGSPVISPLGAIVGATAQPSGQSEIGQTLRNSSTVLATATYTVVPNSGGCDGAPFSIVVTVIPKILPNPLVKQCSCFGANNGAIETNITPTASLSSFQIQWSGPAGFSATTKDISGLSPGTYSLTISYQNSCSESYSYLVTEPSELMITTLSKKELSCASTQDGEIEVSVSGGTPPYVYSWTKDGQVFASIATISNLGAGSYLLSVQDANSCNAKNSSFDLESPNPLVVTLAKKTDVLCFGNATGSIEITVSGGTPLETAPGVSEYNYAWVGPNGFKSSLKNLTQLSVGDYSLIVSDKYGCSQTLLVKISSPEALILSVTTTPITCIGAANATAAVTVTGGKAPYQVSWSNLGSGLQQSNLAPDSYTATVTDANACQQSIQFTIAEATFTLAPKVTDISCNGSHNGSIRLNATGGVPPISVVWSDDASAGSVRNNLGVGSYTVVVRDASPCEITKTFTVVEPQLLGLSAVIVHAQDCLDKNSGAINLSVTGGTSPYTFAWSNGAGTEDVTNVPPGNYSVIVTDANGCQKTGQYEVIRPLPIAISVSSIDAFSIDTKKVVKIYTAEVSGGVPPYQLRWSDGAVRGLNNEIMETSVNGIVIVEVTDAAGCIANLSINVSIPLVKEPYVRIDYKMIDCEKSTYQFTAVVTGAGAEGASFEWDFGDGERSTIKNSTHSYTASGLYRIRLTMTTALGTSICEAKVQVEAIPVLLLDKEAVLCEGGSVVVHASGAQSYLWSDGSVADSMVVRQKDQYTVIGTSKSGCSKTLNFSARYYDSALYNIYTDKDEITTDSVTLHLWSDVLPYSQYFWEFGDGTTGQGNDIFHTYTVVAQEYVDVKLQVVGPDGCIVNALKRIAVKIASPPNVFTPNGDGVNDIFMGNWDDLPINRTGGKNGGSNGENEGGTILQSLDDLQMKVYNRNGILLYTGNNGWDGTYQGKPVLEDTYFYVLYYPTTKGTRTKTGFITVVK